MPNFVSQDKADRTKDFPMIIHPKGQKKQVVVSQIVIEKKSKKKSGSRKKAKVGKKEKQERKHQSFPMIIHP